MAARDRGQALQRGRDLDVHVRPVDQPPQRPRLGHRLLGLGPAAGPPRARPGRPGRRSARRRAAARRRPADVVGGDGRGPPRPPTHAASPGTVTIPSCWAGKPSARASQARRGGRRVLRPASRRASQRNGAPDEPQSSPYAPDPAPYRPDPAPYRPDPAPYRPGPSPYEYEPGPPSYGPPGPPPYEPPTQPFGRPRAPFEPPTRTPYGQAPYGPPPREPRPYEPVPYEQAPYEQAAVRAGRGTCHRVAMLDQMEPRLNAQLKKARNREVLQAVDVLAQKLIGQSAKIGDLMSQVEGLMQEALATGDELNRVGVQSGSRGFKVPAPMGLRCQRCLYFAPPRPGRENGFRDQSAQGNRIARDVRRSPGRDCCAP